MTLDTLMLILLIGSIILLIGTSIMIRDVAFIKNNPIDFAMELIFISFVPALLMVFVFARTRKLSNHDTVIWFIKVLLKLMIFHILFQLSGIYTYAFGEIKA